MEELQLGNPTNVFCCEATGKKVRIENPDQSALLSGDERVFCAEDVALAHYAIEKERGTCLVHVDAIYASPLQNVRRFSTKEQQFEEFMESVKTNGILQPLLVRRSLHFPPAKYELIAGFRRYSAATRLAISCVPVTIIDHKISPRVAGLIENLHEEMKPLELASTLKAIMDEGRTINGKTTRLSQRQLSAVVGIGQSRISNLLGIAESLHPQVVRKVAEGELPVAKAAILKQLPPKEQVSMLPTAEDADVRALRQIANERRESLGIPLPVNNAVRGRRIHRKDRKFKLRPVADVVEACLDAERAYFIEPGQGSALIASKARVQAFQYMLDIIESLTDDPVDPRTLERAAKPEEPAKKRGRPRKSIPQQKDASLGAVPPRRVKVRLPQLNVQ